MKIQVKPRSERETTIKKSSEVSDTRERLEDFRGKPTELKVVELEIGLPVYRMSNCRTFSEQQSEISKQGLDSDFFTRGQESAEAQTRQHNILRKITKNARASIANIDDVLSRDGQREVLLITATGVVVNGNRRLSAMRELFHDNPIQFSNFSYVRCAVLPFDASADDIDDLEAALQARPQTKLEYDWIGEAQLVRRQIQKGRTEDEVANQLRRKVTEIRNLLQALVEAELYLEQWADKSGQYELVLQDGEQLFKDIAKQISTHQDVHMQNASRAIAWSVFENSDRFPGRIYNYSSAFGKHALQVVQYMAEELDIELSKNIEDDNNDFEFSIDDDQVVDYRPFIEALKGSDNAVDVLVDACIREIEKDKGKKRKDDALNSLAQVHSKLAAIDLSTAGKDTYQPMSKQIISINTLLNKLKRDIDRVIEPDQHKEGGTGDNQ